MDNRKRNNVNIVLAVFVISMYFLFNNIKAVL